MGEVVKRETGRTRALDGLRGLACVLVLGFHCGLVSGGAVGVDLFFVLSGFLITKILMREHRDRGAISLSSFYWRRALRLLPALLVLVVVGFGATAVMDPQLLFGPWGLGAPLAVLLFSANWVAVASGQALGVMQPTWSLAVEEQFYLVWAPIVALATSSSRVRRWLLPAVLVAAAASLSFRVWLWLPTRGAYQESHAFYRQYVATDARAYAVLLGVAWALARESKVGFWVRTNASPLGMVSLLALGLISLTYDFYAETGVGLLAPLAGVLLVIAAVESRGPVHKVLEWGPLVGLGRISYSLYLWHMAAFAIVDPVAATDPYGNPPTWTSLVGMLGLALLFGALSYWFVERPVLILRDRYEERFRRVKGLEVAR